MGNPSTRLFINNLDNRYNYVNLTEGKRRVSTLLLSGRKKHRIRSTEQQPYNVSFFSLSLSPPSFTLFDGFARNLKHASRFFTNLATSVAREGVVIDFSPHFYRVSSAEFPTKSWKRSHRSSKFFSITKKKKKTNSIKNDSLYIYIYNSTQAYHDFHSRKYQHTKKHVSRRRIGISRNTYRRGSQRRLLRPGNWNKNETLD